MPPIYLHIHFCLALESPGHKLMLPPLFTHTNPTLPSHTQPRDKTQADPLPHPQALFSLPCWQAEQLATKTFCPNPQTQGHTAKRVHRMSFFFFFAQGRWLAWCRPRVRVKYMAIGKSIHMGVAARTFAAALAAIAVGVGVGDGAGASRQAMAIGQLLQQNTLTG